MQVKVMGGCIDTTQMYFIWLMVNGDAMAE